MIPKGNPNIAKVEHDELLASVYVGSRFLSSERYKGIKLEFKEDKVSISANNPDLGEAVEDIEAEYKGKAGGDRIQCAVFDRCAWGSRRGWRYRDRIEG